MLPQNECWKPTHAGTQTLLHRFLICEGGEAQCATSRGGPAMAVSSGGGSGVRSLRGGPHPWLPCSRRNGVLIASGDLLQAVRGGEVESRMLFHFKDGSLFDEMVMFTQQHVFTLQSYRLVQRGPAFTDDTEISMVRSTRKYHVKTKAHKDRERGVARGNPRSAPRCLQWWHGPYRREEPAERRQRDRSYSGLHAHAPAHPAGTGAGR